MSPVEVFANGIKIFDRQKSVLDCLIGPSKALDCLNFFFTTKRSNWSHMFLIL